MSDEDHQDKSTVPKFCAIRRQGKCDCGNDYIENARKKVQKPWVTYSFPRKGLFKKESAFKVHEHKPEAHHLLCVSSVNEELLGSTIKGYINETVWCINESVNMVPLPLWSHYVQHYCNVEGHHKERGVKVVLTAPDFKNLPCHDWDHRGNLSYKTEVNEKLAYLARQVESRKKDGAHDVTREDIKAALDSLSRRFFQSLRERGKRNGGTHACWLQGMNSPTSSWYMAFSMTSTGSITAKNFPITNFTDEVLDSIDRIAWALF